MTEKKYLAGAGLLLFVVLFCVTRGTCQGNVNEEQGSKAFDSSSGSDLDTVSLTNGGLTLHVPVVSYPQRGNLDLSFFITNSTKQWFVKTTTNCGFNPGCTVTWVKYAWTPLGGQTIVR